ncbi:class F sortase [Exiguobacterium sp. N5]|uniref:class F sortase n=1 Tax=Exiguobacterium sp. N5 TaxID=2990450 RepID=UPI0021F44F2F|nr:class F sortase [Exiguobacterium sp. N5]MCV9899318.1 class F sortase [Exiguobacterium sp. N5]
MERQQLDSTSFVVRSKTLKLIFLGTITFLVWSAQAEAPDKPFVMPTAEFAEPQVLTSKQVDRQTFHSNSFVPARLIIPSIDVDTSIEAVGKDEAGRMDTPSDVNQVGWYQYGAKAGATGNVVLSGHLDDLNGPAIFANLDQLPIGELVTLQRKDQVATYEVVSVKQYRLDQVPLASIFAATQSKRIQLITCAGPYHENLGYRDRIVVTAHLIET